MSDGPERITKPLIAVLDALLDAEDFEMHGWAIMKATGRAGPTIYKMLERLTEAKWVTFRWEDDTEPGKPRRRYYRLTPHGIEQAHSIVTRRAARSTTRRFGLAFGGCDA
jgi:PadR family transcriptional regulator PadR